MNLATLICVIVCIMAVGIANVTVTEAQVIPPANYTDCGSTGKLQEVRITPCPSVPCHVHKGSSVVVEIDFVPKEVQDGITTNVTGQIRDLLVPFRNIRVNACEDIVDGHNRSQCPIHDLGRTYTYKTKLNVKQTYPNLALNVTWKLLGHNGEDIVCFVVPARVVT